MEFKHFKGQNYTELKRQHTSRNLFVDKIFPAENSSIWFSDEGNLKYQSFDITWKRPKEIVEGGRRHKICRPQLRYSAPSIDDIFPHDAPRTMATEHPARGRRRDLDAEDQDAPLGRRDAQPKEPLWSRPRLGLRMAQEHSPLARHRQFHR